MKTIDRWDLERVDYEDYDMVLSSSGDYVMYEDYESLENNYNVLRWDYEILQAGLKKLYLES